MKVSRNWLQNYFDAPLPKAEEIEHALTFHSFEIEESFSVENDTVIDVKVLPNRAGDCLSHRGIAKDLSAIINVPMKEDPFRKPLSAKPESKELIVSIEDPKLCDRYIGAVIKGVKVGPSPEWLKTAIEAVGQRSINNVVDATNYVMLDLGQPLHAFDAAKLSKKETHSIAVRSAKEGEKITTLSNDEYTLTPEVLLITDGNTGEGIGIAGIKGGKAAEITTETIDIIIEAAHFNYASVRKTAQRLKLFTDASTRFQNSPSPEMAGYGMDAVIALVLDIAGGTLEGVIDVYEGAPKISPVSVSLSKVNGLIGTSITEADAEDILKRLDLPFEKSGETFTVTPPFERRDILIPEDLVEEIGRIYGYENANATQLPSAPQTPELNKRFYYAEKIRAHLVSRGFDEIRTYSFTNAGNVEIANPLAEDKKFLRSNLIDAMDVALDKNDRNIDLLGLTELKMFEFGTVFYGLEPYQEMFSLSIGVKNTKNPKAGKADFQAVFDELKEMFLDKNVRDTRSPANGGIAEFDFGPYADAQSEPTEYEKTEIKTDTVKYKTISQYPFVLRDIAVWVPESVSNQEVQNLITEKAGNLLVRLTQFDAFKKEGKVSYAFRLVFQSYEKTLSDDEVNAVMTEVTNTLNSNEGWQVR